VIDENEIAELLARSFRIDQRRAANGDPAPSSPSEIATDNFTTHSRMWNDSLPLDSGLEGYHTRERVEDDVRVATSPVEQVGVVELQVLYTVYSNPKLYSLANTTGFTTAQCNEYLAEDDTKKTRRLLRSLAKKGALEVTEKEQIPRYLLADSILARQPGEHYLVDAQSYITTEKILPDSVVKIKIGDLRLGRAEYIRIEKREKNGNSWEEIGNNTDMRKGDSFFITSDSINVTLAEISLESCIVRLMGPFDMGKTIKAKALKEEIITDIPAAILYSEDVAVYESPHFVDIELPNGKIGEIKKNAQKHGHGNMVAADLATTFLPENKGFMARQDGDVNHVIAKMPKRLPAYLDLSKVNERTVRQFIDELLPSRAEITARAAADVHQSPSEAKWLESATEIVERLKEDPNDKEAKQKLIDIIGALALVEDRCDAFDMSRLITKLLKENLHIWANASDVRLLQLMSRRRSDGIEVALANDDTIDKLKAGFTELLDEVLSEEDTDEDDTKKSAKEESRTSRSFGLQRDETILIGDNITLTIVDIRRARLPGGSSSSPAASNDGRDITSLEKHEPSIVFSTSIGTVEISKIGLPVANAVEVTLGEEEPFTITQTTKAFSAATEYHKRLDKHGFIADAIRGSIITIVPEGEPEKAVHIELTPFDVSRIVKSTETALRELFGATSPATVPLMEELNIDELRKIRNSFELLASSDPQAKTTNILVTLGMTQGGMGGLNRAWGRAEAKYKNRMFFDHTPLCRIERAGFELFMSRLLYGDHYKGEPTVLYVEKSEWNELDESLQNKLLGIENLVIIPYTASQLDYNEEIAYHPEPMVWKALSGHRLSKINKNENFEDWQAYADIFEASHALTASGESAAAFDTEMLILLNGSAQKRKEFIRILPDALPTIARDLVREFFGNAIRFIEEEKADRRTKSYL